MFKLSHILAIYEVKNNSQSSDTPIWGIVWAKEVKKKLLWKSAFIHFIHISINADCLI